MKKFFRKIVSFLKLLFGDNLDKWVSEHVKPSIDLVQRIKKILEHPVAEILTVIIPGDWDEKLRKKMLENLTKALVVLGGVQAFAEADTLEQKLNKIMLLLQSLTPALQQAYLFKLASELSKASGGKDNIKGHSVDLLTQLEYSKLKEGIKDKDLETEFE